MNVAKTKEEIRARDGFRCVDCGMSQVEYMLRYGKKLEVHRHVRGSRYDLEGCVTLCKKCHGKRHSEKGDLIRTGPLTLIKAYVMPDVADRFEAFLRAYIEFHGLRTERSAHIEKALVQYMDREEGKLQ